MKDTNIRLFRKWDALVLLLLLLSALIIFALQESEEKPTSLLVLIDGEVVEDIPLPKEPLLKAYLVDGKEITVCLYPDGAEILSSPCPHQTCIKSGKITRKGSSIHCLPLRFGCFWTERGR